MGPQGDAAAVVEAAAVDDVIAAAVVEAAAVDDVIAAAVVEAAAVDDVIAAVCGVWNTRRGNGKRRNLCFKFIKP